MYKNIIPNLISFDTVLNRINGFSFAENFNFFKKVSKPEIFHYKIEIKKNIFIPRDYDFRNGFYFKKDDNWYYERFFFGISLKLRFDIKNKIFYFNKNYSYIPFEIGGICPVGKHISDLINMDLFFNGYNIFRGCAFLYKGKVFCLIAPGFNGKTSFMCEMIKNGAKYIAEDILIINNDKKNVYPSGCFKKNFGRSINKKLFKNIQKNILSESIAYDYLFLIENFTTSVDKNNQIESKNINNFLPVCSLFFISNNFIRSILSEKNNFLEFFKKIEDIKNNLNFKYIKIKDFNFKKIL